MLTPLLNNTNPSIGIYARRDGVHARISAKANSRSQAESLIQPIEKKIRTILGDAIWGTDDETLEGAIGRMLIEKKLTLGLMESATGGLMADTLTNIPGSSNYLKGSLVTYATETKVSMGVSKKIIDKYGVISRETAEAMAIRAKELLNTDIAISITGLSLIHI